MLKCSISITNPLSKDTPGKFNWYKVKGLTKNKTLEVQLSKFSTYELIRLSLDLSWRGSDHAGLEVCMGILGWEFICKVYDNRHWDYTKGKWEQQ